MKQPLTRFNTHCFMRQTFLVQLEFLSWAQGGKQHSWRRWVCLRPDSSPTSAVDISSTNKLKWPQRRCCETQTHLCKIKTGSFRALLFVWEQNVFIWCRHCLHQSSVEFDIKILLPDKNGAMGDITNPLHPSKSQTS